MRGEDYPRKERNGDKTRITPACAGKTRRDHVDLRCEEDHPRMRGEDYFPRTGSLRHAGSPPHARGRLIHKLRRDGNRRITPACAGKTGLRFAWTFCKRDHPRMRGEDTATSSTFPTTPGSPPHARGRHYFKDGDLVGVRITPACAGKTRSVRAGSVDLRDHPRMRGEDRRFRSERRGTPGSPPHARGRLPQALAVARRRRITPACAGKTPSTPDRRTPWSDHPRMRGEDCAMSLKKVETAGSPPHARGRLVRNRKHGVADRITPACAGKTSSNGP